ncbi:sigma-54-dependent Fis family transcriptional regulator [Phreatobacter stygius]|uniref:Sigma-54-dependent Fis family transcriptional regulator n=1 Tax=Phreatobacter stygius TaxID=1940610 RepID=A0A4D7AYF1_9HYPH|nr:sigma-54-dependent Fis family transcriptional regulator [Phreatobacter stygius]QCI65291.1 sigma-54-dependent Fis family transcriptional regulator [Phreatobacter stygius]
MASLKTTHHAERVLSTLQTLPSVGAEPRIASSWRRCLVEHKLDPARDGPPRTLTQAELKDFIQPMDGLIHLAMPEIETLYRLVRDGGYCVNFTDTNAVMIASRIPPADEALFRQWKLYTGSIFAEAIEGTNGVGTCLAEERPISVHRADHFREHWATMSCKVAPVFDHAGRLAGALNITSCRTELARPANDLALAVTVEAARRIEERIFRAHFGTAWIASLNGGGEDGGGQNVGGFNVGGFLAFDDDQKIIGASRAARLGLGLSDAAIQAGTRLSDVVVIDKGFERAAPETPIGMRRRDGTRLGHARISQPAAQRRSATTIRHRPARPPQDGQAALMRLAGGHAALARDVRRLIALADHDLPVLLHGETGTGKDLFARTLHAAGSRAGRPYVALNCAAMPESLIDSELFGYEAGAFTGARREGSKGLIVQADKGTLFLDEIGDMPLALQTRLLRVLENREVLPLGAGRPVPVDFRLISASHQDLAELTRDGRFRADLYYRLRGLQVDLPALRERTDKAALIDAVAREEAPEALISPAARAALLGYGWPGNIRQLRHVLRLAACTAEAGVIAADDLDLPALGHGGGTPSLAAAERTVIDDVLRSHAGRVPEAAGALGISRATLYRKLKRLRGITPGL